MNDPNYDDYRDFHDDGVNRFLDEAFGPDDTNPCVIRNPGCKFTEKVLDYIFWEWEVEVTQYPHEVQNKVMDMIDFMKGKNNIPNTASKIAMEVLPL
jgi:hypothetical protein